MPEHYTRVVELLPVCVSQRHATAPTFALLAGWVLFPETALQRSNTDGRFSIHETVLQPHVRKFANLVCAGNKLPVSIRIADKFHERLPPTKGVW